MGSGVSLFSFWYCTTILMFNFIHLQPASDHSSQPLHQLVILLSRSAWLMHVSTHSITITMHHQYVDCRHILMMHIIVCEADLLLVCTNSSSFIFVSCLCSVCCMMWCPLHPHRHHPGGSLEYGEKCSITQILLLLVPWPSTGNSNICFLVSSDSFMSIYKN